MKKFLNFFVLSNFSFGIVSGVLACNTPKTTVNVNDNNSNFKPTVPSFVSKGKLLKDRCKNFFEKDTYYFQILRDLGEVNPEWEGIYKYITCTGRCVYVQKCKKCKGGTGCVV